MKTRITLHGLDSYSGLLGLLLLSPLAAQNVGIGTATPAAKLEVYDHDANDAAIGGRIRISADGGSGRETYLDFAPSRTRSGGPAAQIRGIDDGDYSAHLTFWTAPSGNSGNNTAVERMRITAGGNVGIGTTTPEQRLHVSGKIIADDGMAGLPQPSQWGTDGSRLILWPGTADAHPYQIGIASSTLWYGVPNGAQHSFYHGEHEVFAITPTTRGIVRVGNNTNFPSIWLGTLTGGFNTTGPYPTRGTFLFFGGPTSTFLSNTDPALMYFVHLGNDVSRLRIHVEDNGNDASMDGLSIMGASCAGGNCNDLQASQLLFDFATNGEAYKPGGGTWANISDRRTKAEWRPYTRGLAELLALQPLSYRYSEKYFPALKDRWYTGLIAQEVQEVVPEMVKPYLLQCPGDRLEEVLSVNPNDLTYMLINAVKDLDAENARLRAQIDALKEEQNALRSQVEVLMDRLAAIERQLPSSH